MADPLSRRTVIFAGGGTGGHLFPGIAVAQELVRRDAATRILFVGSDKPIERDIVGNAGFEHIALPSVSPSLTSTRTVSSLLNNWRAYRQARAIISRETPSVVVGLGGFASVPPVLAARRAQIPIVLLEQNVVPGKATRWLSRFANVVCLPWAEAARGLSAGTKTIVTGNPIRQEIAVLASGAASAPWFSPDHEPTGGLTPNGTHFVSGMALAAGNSPENVDPVLPVASAKPLNVSAIRLTPPRSPDEVRSLLILGGSQGATTLNSLVLNALEGLVPQLTDWQIIHQTGASDLDAIRLRYANLKLNSDVQPFLRDMVEQYRRATCVISRAGATTLAELACAGLPAILVPLPTSAHDHQRLNAQLFADRNAAVLIEQQTNSEAKADELSRQLTSLLSNDAHRQQLGDEIKRFAKPDAAAAVADAIGHFQR